jgi:hypothetical protein
MADIASIGNINGSASGWIVEIGGGSAFPHGTYSMIEIDSLTCAFVRRGGPSFEMSAEDVVRIGPQLPVQTTQDRRQKSIDASEQMVLRDTIIEPKLIEKARLITDLPTHHRRALLISFDQQESSFRDSLNPFFDSIGHEPKSRPVGVMSGLPL